MVSVLLTFLGCVSMWMACDIFCAPVVEVASGCTVSSGVLRVKCVWILGWTWRLVILSESTFMEVNGLQSECVWDIDILHLPNHVDGKYNEVRVLWVVGEHQPVVTQLVIQVVLSYYKSRHAAGEELLDVVTTGAQHPLVRYFKPFSIVSPNGMASAHTHTLKRSGLSLLQAMIV